MKAFPLVNSDQLGKVPLPLPFIPDLTGFMNSMTKFVVISMTRFVFIIRTCSDSLRHNVVYADRSCTEKNGPRYEHTVIQDEKQYTVFVGCECDSVLKKEKRVNINKPWLLDCLDTGPERLFPRPQTPEKTRLSCILECDPPGRQIDSHRVPKCTRVVLTECEPSVNRASVASQRASLARETN